MEHSTFFVSGLGISHNLSTSRKSFYSGSVVNSCSLRPLKTKKSTSNGRRFLSVELKQIAVVGVPKEIKKSEYRVGIVPSGVEQLTRRGVKVLVEKSAGLGSGIKDSEYEQAGATIAQNAEEVYANSEMIMKVKEPILPEWSLIRPGQLLYTYFHFAASRELTDAMLKSGATCLAYETVQTDDKVIPLLVPMSEVAGRMAIQEGAKYLERPFGGKGVLLSGVPGVTPGVVTIIGGGIVGTNAAKVAAGMGATVYVLDTNIRRLRYLSEIMPDNVSTVFSSPYNLRKLLPITDLLVGAALTIGAAAPKILSRADLALMAEGSVFVDVAIDQGGVAETSIPTTHTEPTYVEEGVVHYCVANIPGAVPTTSTYALTNVTLPYAIDLVEKGWRRACLESLDLQRGLNIIDGHITYGPVADAFDLPHKSPEVFLQGS
mmetsp:Transcript_37614/g.60934  ORF Transcript_37614/g.60934 Transcript_37614/m.60934 type:complete len:432 (+) Transcript_37614:159-1454(+)|eukprot:CAMPEP_0184672506 /NCGR_PEP_ID=MMETSP0308-20130426/86138_1 /TAXON_ID=38269 /ORGANISM="Gloeochaete witrockiana, Strain SAG 46.84" /LENGTH=431 /DNA_ID=CAMNT_0027119843 /DNA_START=87 /DNA_END=1382 /DNA_ORIENTATION=+